ncbi:hypothetical protein FRC17_003053, partial [Serendipita sp. 399]
MSVVDFLGANSTLSLEAAMWKYSDSDPSSVYLIEFAIGSSNFTHDMLVDATNSTCEGKRTAIVQTFILPPPGPHGFDFTLWKGTRSGYRTCLDVDDITLSYEPTAANSTEAVDSSTGAGPPGFTVTPSNRPLVSDTNRNRGRRLVISLTVVGLVVVPILAGLLFCCCKRRKQRATRGVDEEEGRRDSQEKLNPSGAPTKAEPSIRTSLSPIRGGIPDRPTEPTEPREQEQVVPETTYSEAPPQSLRNLSVAKAADPNENRPQEPPLPTAPEAIAAEEDPTRPYPELTDAPPPIYILNGPITSSEQPLPEEPVASPSESIAGSSGGNTPAMTQKDVDAEEKKEEEVPVKNLEATKNITADDEPIEFGTGSTTGYSRET